MIGCLSDDFDIPQTWRSHSQRFPSRVRPSLSVPFRPVCAVVAHHECRQPPLGHALDELRHHQSEHQQVVTAHDLQAAIGGGVDVDRQRLASTC